MSGALRGKIVSEAEFRRLWNDRSQTLAQIGQRLGISQQAVTTRASRRGLVNSRPMGPKPVIGDEAGFRKMWAAGVMIAEMAAHFSVHERSIRNHVERLGLPKRGCNGRGSVTLAAFQAEQLRAKLDAEAARTRTAFRMAEMVDGLRSGRRATQ